MHAWAVVDPVLGHDARLREVCDRLVRIVRSGWTDLPEIDVGDPAIRRFLSRHRVATLVPLAAVPTSARDGFAASLKAIYATQLRIEATAHEIGETLAEHGIDCRLLKGLASAHLDYPRPELRQTGDVDLLVPSDSIDRVVALLKAAGCTARPEVRAPELHKGTTVEHPTPGRGRHPRQDLPAGPHE